MSKWAKDSAELDPRLEMHGEVRGKSARQGKAQEARLLVRTLKEHSSVCYTAIRASMSCGVLVVCDEERPCLALPHACEHNVHTA